jgi:CRISPR-associated protein Csh2
MENQLLSNNSDFLFLYEAIQCNPNGDIDQENRPRMDYDNDINLVTDVRIKRYVRDFLKATGQDIFVDMEGENKVSPDSKLKAVLLKLLANDLEMESFFANENTLLKKFEEVKSKNKGKSVEDTIKFMQKNKDLCFELNHALLAYLVKQKFVDIRFFGSAFAIEGFTRSYTGPIQLNWGYSLHKVQIMDSSSIVTIMNDGNSTIGKDYRVHYSLLGFVGSINKYAAISTGLTNVDVELFRKALWESIPALPTRSKMNQYPKLYVEVIYNDGFNNGYFGDMRQFLEVSPNNGLEEKQIRKYADLTLNAQKLIDILKVNTGEGKAVKEVKIKTAEGVSFTI